jgi:hypothetical protein
MNIRSLSKFNTWYRKQNTIAWKGTNLQVLMDWGEWRHRASTIERKAEEHTRGFKNKTEIWVECQG